MQNEQTLIELGFYHHPEWNNIQTGTKHYRLDYKGLVFRAHIWGKDQGFHGISEFVSLGLVVKHGHIVDYWRDCCSNGSVKRAIDKIKYSFNIF